MKVPNVIRFTETETWRANSDEEPTLTQESVLEVNRLYGRYIDVTRSLAGSGYELGSKHVIGHFPVSENLSIVITPKVSIINIFRMLEYAFDLESFEILPGEARIETVEELFERFASILAQRVLKRVRKGLYCNYFPETDLLPYVRGRICLTQTIRQAAQGASKLCCLYDEFSRDIDDNRILFWTLHSLRRIPFTRSEPKKVVQLAYRALLGSITLTPVEPSECLKRSYNRLNDDYRSMHRLCGLLLQQLGPGLHEAGTRLLPFRVNTWRLFELFVFRWLEAHIASDLKVEAKENAYMDASFELKYDVDIVLRDSDDKVLAVLDTKYKTHKVPEQEDVNQVAIYAKLMGCTNAILIYPSDESNCEEAYFEGVTIRSLKFDISKPADQGGKEFLNGLYQTIGRTPSDRASYMLSNAKQYDLPM
ncbi:MAG: McrC family protein [Halobacteriota archaeon]